MSRELFTGTVLGHYETPEFVKPYEAKGMKIPPHWSSSKKIAWDSSLTNQRIFLYTDRGNFAAPVTQTVIPGELETDDVTIRNHKTFPIRFKYDFRIIAAILLDIENQQVISPVEQNYPIDIIAGSLARISFDFPYYIRGRR